jgi:hypothetical protein
LFYDYGRENENKMDIEDSILWTCKPKTYYLTSENLGKKLFTNKEQKQLLLHDRSCKTFPQNSLGYNYP